MVSVRRRAGIGDRCCISCTKATEYSGGVPQLMTWSWRLDFRHLGLIEVPYVEVIAGHLLSVLLVHGYVFSGSWPPTT